MIKILILILFTLNLCYAKDVSNRNIVHGTSGDDRLVGSKDVDELHGGSGNDTIIGGFGKDYLYGDSGADTFVIDTNSPFVDEVMDFDPNEGDTVLFNFGKMRDKRGKSQVPKDFGTDDIKIDFNGYVKLFLDKKWVTVVRLDRSNLSIKNEAKDVMINIDENNNNVRLSFRKKF